MKNNQDPFQGIENVFWDFEVKKGKSWEPDYPYLKLWFSHAGFFYKINFKWIPVPKLFWKIRSEEWLLEKMKAIKSESEAAMFIIEQFWFAIKNISANKQPPMKVVIQKDTSKKQ